MTDTTDIEWYCMFLFEIKKTNGHFNPQNNFFCLAKLTACWNRIFILYLIFTLKLLPNWPQLQTLKSFFFVLSTYKVFGIRILSSSRWRCGFVAQNLGNLTKKKFFLHIQQNKKTPLRKRKPIADIEFKKNATNHEPHPSRVNQVTYWQHFSFRER